MTLTEVLLGIVIAIGLVGILVPLLPGTVLVLGAVLVWAVQVGTGTGWTVFAVAATLLVLGSVVKYVVPGRRLKEAGVPVTTQLAGAAAGVVGFFVVPVLGLVLGFVLGIYLAERARLGAAAWPSTKHALRAVGLSILIELTAALAATLVWVVGVIVT